MACSFRRAIYRGKGADQREAVHLPRVKGFEDYIGPIDSVMPKKTHKESRRLAATSFLVAAQ